MKVETLKALIELEFKNSETAFQFKNNVLKLIDIYENDKSITHNPTLPYTPVSGDKVPYSTICGCNTANGGNGICGCTIANKLVTPGVAAANAYTSITDMVLDYKYNQ